MLTSGQLLAERYRLSRRIAVGGMGEVWEAADTRLDRRVAVKVLKPELCGDAEFLHRFRIEARTTASLNHPGIAAVHDYGETAAVPDGPQDTAYLVMELVEGEPLAAILAREGRLPADRTLDILEQAGVALQAAHQRGLVHRDVKPGNILVTPTGAVKLTDFGIAKAADAAPVTRSGMVMGTAHYIAPEQALGHEAEPASDVYSLAVCGYECLAGHRPFLSENAVTVAMMHIRDIAPPLPPDVPPGARALIEATLVKDPRHRYRSGGEFASAVTAVRAGQPLPTPSGLAMVGHHPQAPGVPPMLAGPHGQHPLTHPGSVPGMQPVVLPPAPVGQPGPLPGPPQGPPPGPPPGPLSTTGTFTPIHVPVQRGRTGLWVLITVLVGVVIVLGVIIAWMAAPRDDSTGPAQPRHGTSGSREPAESEVVPGEDHGVDSEDQDATPRRTGGQNTRSVEPEGTDQVGGVTGAGHQDQIPGGIPGQGAFPDQSGTTPHGFGSINRSVAVAEWVSTGGSRVAAVPVPRSVARIEKFDVVRMGCGRA
ncbi:serine/threonine-protein kinase [Goodfellowiella coeruleoviolacea]|uniref:non-specific serine/threonine protein kinase n=1 Tax=Goodfellowiella coeruleoviolacea TaxID=334858 RepID=A0AAE3GK81_9PSEU|nr:serine/threonine-protein kinase [Goodfellowiella coeruleoviolacea]MCP2168990.1 serine/threonine protein kinase [Goodfellowiella coeruleoviolacea]